MVLGSQWACRLCFCALYKLRCVLCTSIYAAPHLTLLMTKLVLFRVVWGVNNCVACKTALGLSFRCGMVGVDSIRLRVLFCVDIIYPLVFSC